MFAVYLYSVRQVGNGFVSYFPISFIEITTNLQLSFSLKNDKGHKMICLLSCIDY